VGRFFLDENVQGVLSQRLQADGHVVVTATEAGLDGSADDRILLRARELDSVLITADPDFANVIRFPVGTHSGIVVLRLKRLLSSDVAARTAEAVSNELPPDMAGCLAIVDETKTRIRRP
jgi:predicted nuclease of predicted toxin-antitoxin system